MTMITDYTTRAPSASRILGETDLRERAPSIFAEQPVTGLSPKYTYIPTIEVVRSLAEVGLVPVLAREARVRLDERRGFQRHLIRFRNPDQRPMLGGVHPEVVLMNSHDGTSGYRVEGGLFRLVCLNGMVVPHGGSFGATSFRTRHTGRILEQVLDATGQLIHATTQLPAQIERLMATDLAGPVIRGFAERAMRERFGERAPVTVDQVLRSRRDEDAGFDAWRVLNRVQENLVRGGLEGRSASGRRTTTREIRGISQDVGFNRFLFQLMSDVVDATHEVAEAPVAEAA